MYSFKICQPVLAFAALVASTVAYAQGVPSEPVLGFDRAQLSDDIAHYRYDIAVGTGPYDVVRIHRIVRERRPNKPVGIRDAVMLLPGSPNSFEGIFMAPLVTGVSESDHSIVMFLAKNDIDVWGMDYGWALVPPDETDFEFMGQWGLAKDVAHARAALDFVQSSRVGSGQGNGRLHVLGLSYGGQVAYTLVGDETMRPPGLRSIKGLIALDIGVKLASEGDREFYCAMAEADRADLDSNPPIYVRNTGQLFQLLAFLAGIAPEDWSPIFPFPISNWQAALFVGASTELLMTGQFWHLVGGYLDEFGIPSALRFTDDQLWVAAMGVSFSPYYPVRIDLDTDQLLCGTFEVPFDDYFAQITVPILHIAAKGGFGPSAYASTTFTTSREVTTITVQRLSDEDEAMDFGHVDTVLATEAETLVWRPILDWIMAHRNNRP